jgi:hypothetical protein
MAPVLAAGVGVRHGWTWVLRAASFRLDPPAAGRPTVGIAVPRDTARSVVIDLLGGLARPAYGELRVLGQDLTTAQGRAAVRRYVGIARASTRPRPVGRYAAWSGRPPGGPTCPAGVHEPELLLLDGLADGILVRDLTQLARPARTATQPAHRTPPISCSR